MKEDTNAWKLAGEAMKMIVSVEREMVNLGARISDLENTAKCYNEGHEMSGTFRRNVTEGILVGCEVHPIKYGDNVEFTCSRCGKIVKTMKKTEFEKMMAIK